MFLDRLRERNVLFCMHPDAFFQPVSSPDKTDEWIQCTECKKYVISIRKFLCHDTSPLDSHTLAREYAEWTGRVDVPCRLDLTPLRHRVLPGILLTKYNVLHRGYHLLRAVHSPFVFRKTGGESVSNLQMKPVDPKIFQNLMTEYLGLIDRVSSNVDSQEKAEVSEASGSGGGGGQQKEVAMIRTLLTNMKNVFADVDMHDQYFNVLAPYVKLARDRVLRMGENEGETSPLPPQYSPVSKNEGYVWTEDGDDAHYDKPFGLALMRELDRSSFIHQHFSRYCIPFEVLHVMVLCYLCGDNTDTVYNLVLDMTAKLCSRFYSFPVSRVFPIGLKIRHCLEKNIVPIKNLKLYYFLQKFKNGGENLDEYFSEELLREYGALETEIHKYAPIEENNKIEKFIYQQTFPYILFEDDERDDDSGYYAFIMALAHYVSRTRFGTTLNTANLSSCQRTNPLSVPKGVIAECRKIYRFVRKCIGSVREFDGGEASAIEIHDKKRSMYWTKDMFHLFLASNSDLGKDLADVLKMLMYSTDKD